MLFPINSLQNGGYQHLVGLNNVENPWNFGVFMGILRGGGLN
jgi:hypothetical protein